MIAEPIKDARRRRRDSTKPWTVAVVRMGYVGSWNDLSPTVVHQEELAPAEAPDACIEALVADVRVGRFHPAS